MSSPVPPGKKASPFKPLTEGLGLNHFADGLPYTPEAAKRRAVQNFNFPSPRAPQYKSPAPVKTHTQQNTVHVSPELERELTQALTLSANLFKRVSAFLIDEFAVLAVFFVVFYASLRLNGINLAHYLLQDRASEASRSLLKFSVMFFACLHFSYFLLLEAGWRTTLGKALLGMRIKTSSSTAAFFRALCFYMSIIPFGLGLVWALFDSKKRCWHDVITDSEVVE